MPSRMGFDLTTKIGWESLKYTGWKSAKYYIWGDTFKKFICLIKGHIKFDTMNGSACKRCSKYV